MHRDQRLRAALRRLSGAGDAALLGGPDDADFREAPPPRVVLLGVAGDFEAELEFAHRHAERLPAARWLLLADPADRADAERLFDALPAEWLEYPPSGVELRRRIHAAARRRRQDELSMRRLRDALSSRFARFFAELELDEVLRALDPRLASVPFLARGEPGTGRGLLTRYVHTFGGAGGRFVEIDCRALSTPAALRAAFDDAAAGAALSEPGGVTVCLREVDALPAAAQYALREYVELAPPGALARARPLRWMATAGDDAYGLRTPGLAPELAETLAGLSQRIPPLRDRGPEAIRHFAEDTAEAWCRARGERPRRLAPETLFLLQDDPWPGNQRELEAVLARTLAAEPSDPILPEQLRFDEMSRASANPEEPERPPLRAPWGRNAGTAEEAAAQAQAAGAQGRDESGDDARAEGRRPAWLTQPPLPSDDRSRLPQPRPPAPAPPPRPAPAATPGDAGATRAGGAKTGPGAPRVEPPPARPPASGPAANERARSEAEPRPGPVAAPVGTDAATRPAAPAVLAAESGANGAAPAAASPGLAPLALSLAHELRNRLVAIRTFAALLPERAEDRGFRDEFSQVVGADVRRMERALERLASFAALPGPAAREPVDVAALLDEELEALRGEIESRRLLVLKELDRGQPAVLADRAALAFAFEAILFRAFEWMPDRGDLYLASKAVAASRDAGPAVRVVLRFHRPGERRGAAGASAPRDRELALELVLAELALRPHGGRLRVDATDAEETMIVVDLPGA